MPSGISRVQSPDKDLNQFQQNANTALAPIFGNPINYGAQLVSVSLASGDTAIAHGLNRTLQGWFIVRRRASCTVYDKYDTQDSSLYPQKQYLLLNSSAAAVVDIWVY